MVSVTKTFAEPDATPLALLLLGRGTDPASERGVDCPGALPAPSDPDLVARAERAKAALGDRVFVLGHHYQRCLLYTSPSPRDRQKSRMPSSA